MSARSTTVAEPMNTLLALLTAIATVAGSALFAGSVTWSGTVPLAVVLAGLVPVGKRWPVQALLASAVVLIGCRGAGLFEGGWIWPLTVAFHTAADAGRTRLAAGVGVFTLAYGHVWDSVVASKAFTGTIASTGTEALWLALVLAVARVRHRQRQWRAEHEARLEVEARRRLAEQRLDISRELHDIVAHTLAVVGVHINVAADALHDDPEEAAEALRTAQAVRAEAMTDLRSLVALLRRDDSCGVPVSDLASVAALVEQARATGLTVSLTEDGDPGSVPAVPAVTAYRVIQEALTNAIKHAGCAHVSVRLTCTPEHVTVLVEDDGRVAGPITEGNGLTGMRERITALGGTLTITGSRGLAVHARIPVRAGLQS
ncbi:sensor histidine kinase [Streptosporangium sp. NPDC004379]|uniref:sensor histidine kinase n=1 Tax=Streptosporangium sp. NPDC004379 TaxID=3366189 RepID=UPI0036BDD6EA